MRSVAASDTIVWCVWRCLAVLSCDTVMGVVCRAVTVSHTSISGKMWHEETICDCGVCHGFHNITRVYVSM